MSEQEQATAANIAVRLEEARRRVELGSNTVAEAVYLLARERFENGHYESAAVLLKQISC